MSGWVGEEIIGQRRIGEGGGGDPYNSCHTHPSRTCVPLPIDTAKKEARQLGGQPDLKDSLLIRSLFGGPRVCGALIFRLSSCVVGVMRVPYLLD